jgi:hypothetical protein
MKKQNTKQALFEMMQKVNPDFKLLREDVDGVMRHKSVKPQTDVPTNNPGPEKPIIALLNKIFNPLNIKPGKGSFDNALVGTGSHRGQTVGIETVGDKEAIISRINKNTDLIDLRHDIGDLIGDEHIENINGNNSFWLVAESNFPELY